MSSLPKNARYYLIGIYLTSAITVLLARQFARWDFQGTGFELSVFMVLAALAGGKKINLVHSKHASVEGVGSMSLGFAITFAAMLRFGPSGGFVIGAVTSLSACLYPKRQAMHQLLFNVALTAVESWVSGFVYLAANGWSLQFRLVEAIPAVTAACLSYYAVNTGGVATIIALCTEQKPFAVWQKTFLWTAPSYFAGAGVAALSMCLHDKGALAVAVFVTPAAILTYHSYANYTARAEEKQKHIEELQGSQTQLADLYLATIKSLALAIDAKDQYTHQHILRVQRYAVATAVHMGLDGIELEGVNTGALLHDIGKLGVPEYVLLKPGRLTDEEFAKIKKHPEIGAAILDPVEFPWPVLPVVKYHHEKWDGTGYPEGLAGEDIPLTARILSVADVYDALTSSRSYRNAWSHERALETIRRDAGTHFDPKVVDAFLEVIEGVVAEMAAEGCGPLVAAAGSSGGTATKAEMAVRDIQRSSSELWALYEVAQTLSSSLGLQETLDILARKLGAILPGTACVFLLKDELTNTLLARAAVGVNKEFFEGCRTMNPDSKTCTAVRERQTFSGAYDQDDLMLISSQSTIWEPLNSCMIVPIVHQGEVLGTINLYHPDHSIFDEHDQQLLETIAERAALALYNGLLFDRTQSHALTDPLTGLHNMRYLTQQVDCLCSNPDPQPFAILCLDLDNFKPINDNFGHQKGDEVLRTLGKLFQKALGPGPTVTRYGGDEFVVIVRGAERAEAEAVASRLMTAVEQYDPDLYHPRLGALRLGVSTGFACFPADGADCATLLSAADSHMYRVKTERKLGSLAGARKPRLIQAVPSAEDAQLPKAA